MAALLALLLAAAACDDEPEGPGAEGVAGVTHGLALIVAAPLPEGAAPRLFVVARSGTSARGRGEGDATLGERIEIETAGRELIAYVPDSGSFDGSSFGPGLYARLGGVSDGRTVGLYGLSRADELPPVAGAMSLTLEGPPTGTIELDPAEVTGDWLVAVDGAPVDVPDLLDSIGSDRHRVSVPAGFHTVIVVSGDRSASQTLEVEAGETVRFDAQMEEASAARYRLIDRVTEAPVAGAQVRGSDVTVETGEDGRFALSSGYIKDIRKEHYAPRSFMSNPSDAEWTVPFAPLIPELYGTWNLCTVRSYGPGGWTETEAKGDPVVFRSTGTANLPGNSADITWENDYHVHRHTKGSIGTGTRSRSSYLDTFWLEGDRLKVSWYRAQGALHFYGKDCGGPATEPDPGPVEDPTCANVCAHLASACAGDGDVVEAEEECLEECAREEDDDHFPATIACCAEPLRVQCAHEGDVWEMCEATCRE